MLQPQGVQQEEENISAEAMTDEWIGPQQMADFATYWFTRTDWDVYNPNPEPVEVRVQCNRYGYNVLYSIAPYSHISGRWGCEGATLYIHNRAPLHSNYFVKATVW